MAAFRKRKSYVELYKQHAHAKYAPWLARLLPSERDTLEEIENDRSVSVSGLMHWRTIADAQVGKEREKVRSKQKESMGTVVRGESANHSHHGAVTPVKGQSSIKSSFASSLLGTPSKKESLSKRESSADSFYECLDEENVAPIALTPDEMKELEELAIKKADRSLTKDSMFCDVNFNLGSFQVNLLTAQNTPLTSLEM